LCVIALVVSVMVQAELNFPVNHPAAVNFAL